MKDLTTFLEILISMNWSIEEGLLYQTFSYKSSDKAAKFLRKNGYILYDKFEEKITELAFESDKLEFLERKDEKGRTVLIFSIVDRRKVEKDLYTKMFKLSDVVPPNPGCAYCVHKKDLENGYFTCCYKNKTMAQEYKNCKYFKQRNLMKNN